MYKILLHTGFNQDVKNNFKECPKNIEVHIIP
jgi:hypothetical protein